ncbi:hypothetical protein ABE437_18820 [Isoptericola cucumis]|uniref:hypothetical protein n=1 Tax=Isoptericola cucumis TaxID=1776856 RepID=UPI003209B797
MTTTTPAATTVPLADGEYPCPACGVAVRPTGPDHLTTMTILGRDDGQHLQMFTRTDARLPTVTMARCPDCLARHEQAQALLNAHPVVTKRLGSPDVALRRLTGALDGLAVLHASPAEVERLTASDVRLRVLIGALAAPGIASTWASLFAPVMAPGVRPDSAAVQAWSHLSRPDAQVGPSLREGYAQVLRATADATTRLAPPADGSPRGCLVCGLASVSAPVGTQPAHVWALVSADRSALGGRRSPDRLRGYLCPDCADAKEVEGSIGPSAMERSLLAHLDIGRKSLTPTALTGLVGWAAQIEPGEPSDEPWEHVDVEAVRDTLG